MDPIAEAAQAQARQAAMTLPLATEKISHGEPTWFVDGKKSFAMFCTYHHGMRLGIWMAAPAGIQEMLIESDADRFYRPPYVGPRGWVGVNLDTPFDSQELLNMLTEAYRHVAPPKYLKMLD